MSKTYAQIQQQIETLKEQAEKLKRKEVEGVIGRIKEAITAYGLTAADLGLDGSASRNRSRGPVAKRGPKPGRKAKTAGVVKFRNEAGKVWGGRGPRPQWLREALATGKSLQDFAV
ncbi:MAG: H-NS histone family protein [Pseudomonadota bacterium]